MVRSDVDKLPGGRHVGISQLHAQGIRGLVHLHNGDWGRPSSKIHLVHRLKQRNVSRKKHRSLRGNKEEAKAGAHLEILHASGKLVFAENDDAVRLQVSQNPSQVARVVSLKQCCFWPRSGQACPHVTWEPERHPESGSYSYVCKPKLTSATMAYSSEVTSSAAGSPWWRRRKSLPSWTPRRTCRPRSRGQVKRRSRRGVSERRLHCPLAASDSAPRSAYALEAARLPLADPKQQDAPAGP
ncbi:hypothetical protein DFJ74DRAFT_119310 [Hyaloraphidium curvatum]|nr:hypothetical protein DFJ74DRAFT_119310 [Hyaloraphidium curvatum]